MRLVIQGRHVRALLASLTFLLLSLPRTALGAGCNQAALEGSQPSNLSISYAPGGGFNNPFYQWQSNLGYCGETSLVQSAMSYGTWISQYNARTIATSFGASISQTGVAEGKKPAANFAQILLDDAPQKGENVFSKAASNLGLVATNFDSVKQPSGQAGYQIFMQWIKGEISKGNRVTIGVVMDNSGSREYDHIVSVVRFDTNSPGSAYNSADVLYVDDHGVITSVNSPAVPLGSSSSRNGCTPFIFGYQLSKWSSKISSSKSYAIPVPTRGSKNYGTSISGIKDMNKETLPVSLSFTTSNPQNPICGWQYESPYIGSSDTGSSTTNKAPAAQIMNITATVSSLVAGSLYNLYTYKWTTRPLASGALPIPTSNFNFNAAKATSILPFSALGSTYRTSFIIKSSDSIVIRVVHAGSIMAKASPVKKPPPSPRGQINR